VTIASIVDTAKHDLVGQILESRVLEDLGVNLSQHHTIDRIEWYQ